MQQAEMFPAEPPARVVEHGGYMPPAIDSEDCERDVLNALQLYRDDNDMGWEPETRFDALQIGAMATCQPDGPFCIAVLPVFLLYSVGQVYKALRLLDASGEVIEEREFYGSRSPAEGNYRGYGYRYRVRVKT